MKLAEKHAVRYLKVMTCTNAADPCGMGLWEGVPLREVMWLTRPKANLRRVFYYGYHNDDPKQRFQSSLPVGRVLEDPPGEQPVILCYKLNGEWLTPKAGAPVRMIVPEAYGNKSVKWLQRIVLTNNYQANDTYATWNNDVESPLKTYARFLQVPKTIKVGQLAAVTGVAQVGMSGLSKVQYWLHPRDAVLPEDDSCFIKGGWQDAVILAPPGQWGGGSLHLRHHWRVEEGGSAGDCRIRPGPNRRQLATSRKADAASRWCRLHGSFWHLADGVAGARAEKQYRVFAPDS